jgi:lipopolysaccharide/colanic/teichoic acid biosynthesis glycosyltransferase
MYKFRTITDARSAAGLVAGELFPDEDRLTESGTKLRAKPPDELPKPGARILYFVT